MIVGQCLCGAHRFEVEGPFEFNHHCHCGFCRKHHGSAFVTLIGVAPERLRWVRGEVIAYESSPGLVRESCATCGSGLPQQIEGLPIFVPAGCLDDLDTSMEFHIFAAFKAPWYEIADGLPAFDTYPPGVDAEALPTRVPKAPTGGVRGSCLCGDVHYVIDGPAITARHCHCTRCRRGRAAAYASNLITSNDALRFTGGEGQIRRFKVPDAEFFTQTFCGRCGSKLPTVDANRGVAVIPLGGLDDAPPALPSEHIFTADVPPWSAIHDALPQHPGRPG